MEAPGVVGDGKGGGPGSGWGEELSIGREKNRSEASESEGLRQSSCY